MAEKFCAIIETDAIGVFHPEDHANLRRGIVHLTNAVYMGCSTDLRIELSTGERSCVVTIELRHDCWAIYTHDEAGQAIGQTKLFDGSGSKYEKYS